MSDYYRAYIIRNGEEYEVTAQLYEHGKAESGIDHLGGYWSEVTEDPIFTDFAAFDDYGVELILTPRDIHSAEEQMIKSYWETL